MPQRTPALKDLLADRTKHLEAYQDAAYAQRYERVVREVAALEQQRTGSDRFTREVAISLHRLMAYKDEYEVARLYVETGFFDRLAQQFEGNYTLRFHLAPPLLSKRDDDGHLVKRAYGPWIATAFKWLAKARRLRGTPLDVFGYTAERRGERAAIFAFETLARRLAGELTAERLATALELARLPQTVRGFGHVKERNRLAAEVRMQALLASFEASFPVPSTARIAA